MLSRIILKIKGKCPEDVKSAIKSIDGYWDDLFDAWSLPIESSIHIKPLMNGIDHEMRQVNLPKSHVTKKPRDRAMHWKYADLTKKLIHDELRLMSDIVNHEKSSKRLIGTDVMGRPIYDLPWSSSMYEIEPKVEDKPYTTYLIEKKFHERLLEIKHLRKEINQIHQELKAMEEQKKG